MREIEFRGKAGKWVYGSLINAPDYCCILQDVENLQSIDYPYLNGDSGTFDGYATPIDKNTIGQYTGLKDKNGTKIFEGDILKLKQPKDEREFIAKVEFGNPNGNYDWGWQLVFVKPYSINNDILCWVGMECIGIESEVVGNIYDNPELIGE